MKIDLRKTRSVHVAAILLIGFILYGQVLDFEFVTTDDRGLIVSNPHVTDWAETSLRDRFLTVEFAYAIPVTVASFALDWELYGGKAWGFHLTNLLLHLACSLLVMLFLFQILRMSNREAETAACWSFVGALVFLLHPVQAEAVAFVTQRKDLLVTFFALLAVCILLRAIRKAQPRWIFISLIAVVLSGLSKPSSVLLGLTLAGVHLSMSRSRFKDFFNGTGETSPISPSSRAVPGCGSGGTRADSGQKIEKNDLA